MIPEEPYRIRGVEGVLTPALAVYPQIADSNIAATLRLLGGDPNRWRPHVKTAKLGCMMRRMAEHGVGQAKCSTTVELTTAIEAGIPDVLLAYPVVGANARRVAELARHYTHARISVLVENPAQVAAWRDTPISIFVDVNPGMNRTGIEQERIPAVLEVARAIAAHGLRFRGLHYYDGHLAQPPLEEREHLAHKGYDRLTDIVAAVEGAGFAVEEVITSGTPAFPCAASYPGFRNAGFVHRASPGTVLYSDLTSLSQLPEEWGYRPAALVVSTVVSHPVAHYVTCDAGHKSVSADAGIPTCAVAGRPELRPLKPSEEHLPIEVPAGAARPAIGDVLYLVPRHVCPTVNNFDHALMVSANEVVGVEPVTARGHEAPVAPRVAVS